MIIHYFSSVKQPTVFTCTNTFKFQLAPAIPIETIGESGDTRHFSGLSALMPAIMDGNKLPWPVMHPHLTRYIFFKEQTRIRKVFDRSSRDEAVPVLLLIGWRFLQNAFRSVSTLGRYCFRYMSSLHLLFCQCFQLLVSCQYRFRAQQIKICLSCTIGVLIWLCVRRITEVGECCFSRREWLTLQLRL